MIDQVAELNRVLFAVTELSTRGKANRESVIELCETAVIEGRMPNHAATIAFAERIGFLTSRPKTLSLSDEGQTFLSLNPPDQYDMSEEQKRFILKNCFLHGPLSDETREVLEGFSPAYGDETFKWSPVDSPPLKGEAWIAEHLCQIGILVRVRNSFEVAREFVGTVSSFLDEEKGLSEEKLQEILRTKREVGAIAEQLILAFEADRLRKKGHAVESHCIRQISKLKVNAGYDIESFDGKAPGLNFDRFIEVKGAKSQTVHFFWSQNEIEVAKKLHKRYWIYFQGGVNPKLEAAKNKPILFQDPINSILKDNRLKRTPQGIIVEGKLKGAAIAIG